MLNYVAKYTIKINLQPAELNQPSLICSKKKKAANSGNFNKTPTEP